MVTVQNKLDAIKEQQNYVTGSLVLKSSNETGAVYKYLISTLGVGTRKEIFYSYTYDPELNIEEQTVNTEVEIEPAN